MSEPLLSRASWCCYAPLLLHQGAFTPVFKIDAVRVEVSPGGDDHDLRHRQSHLASRNASHKDDAHSATIHHAPLVGRLRNAKSREGSLIFVSVFGRYPPTDDVMFFVRFSDRRRRLDDPPFNAPTPSRLSTCPIGSSHDPPCCCWHCWCWRCARLRA
jgi:hypothetical protein